MADLVAITAPDGRVYRVHPFISEQGEWFASDRAGLRRQLPTVTAFERDLAEFNRNHTAPPAPVRNGVANER